MTHVDLTATYATWVSSAAPTTCYYGKSAYVSAQSGSRQAFLQFASPWPASTTQNVTRATLTLHTATALSGDSILQVALLTSPVTLGTATWNNTRKATATGTVSVEKNGSTPAGSAWVFDVTSLMQQVASGARKFYGFMVTSGTASYSIPVRVNYSAALNPTLSVDFSQAPLPPGNLEPSGGRIIGDPKPSLTFGFVDAGGDTTLQAAMLQLSTSSTMNPLTWAGTVPTTVGQIDLSTVQGAPTLTDGTTYWWNVRVQDGAGLWSNWSNPTSFVYRAKPVLTLVNPDPTSPVVYDPTPPIDWTYQSSSPQSQWAVQVWKYTASGALQLVTTSGVQTGTDSSWVPDALPGTGKYQVRVTVWDSYTNREATPGQGIYQRISQDFTYQPLASAPHPTGIVASKPNGLMPAVTLDWTLPAQPDEWIIYRDGKPMGRFAGAALLHGSSNTYRWTDALAPAGEHTWDITPVINHQSAPSGYITWSNRFAGTWLMAWTDDRHTDYDAVRIVNDLDHALQLPEQSAQLDVLGSPRPITVVTGMQGGYSGKVDGGVLVEAPGLPAGQTPTVWRDNLLAFKVDTGREFRLLGVGDLDLPVMIHNVNVAPLAHLSKRPMFTCSFDYYQTSDYLVDFGG